MTPSKIWRTRSFSQTSRVPRGNRTLSTSNQSQSSIFQSRNALGRCRVFLRSFYRAKKTARDISPLRTLYSLFFFAFGPFALRKSGKQDCKQRAFFSGVGGVVPCCISAVPKRQHGVKTECTVLVVNRAVKNKVHKGETFRDILLVILISVHTKNWRFLLAATSDV